MMPWVLFNLFVLAMLVLDLAVFHRKSHVVSVREAVGWSFFWITLALLFNLGIWWFHGPEKALEFLTGYLIEKSLSVDNLFVFLIIFSYFCVPDEYQHKVLFWGILGALALRAVFIVVGTILIHQFHWILYLFGGFLVFTGIKLFKDRDQKMECHHNPVIKLTKRWLPVTDRFHGDKFFVRLDAKWFATPLLVVLIVVETTDVVFALDSIPAIFAVTIDPFIVFTSNVFAILGLRALYFALAGAMRKFHYLNFGLSAILVFVGIKMLITDWVKVPIGWALGFVVGALILSILASIYYPPKK